MIVLMILAKMDSALILRMPIDVSVNLAMVEKNVISSRIDIDDHPGPSCGRWFTTNSRRVCDILGCI